MWNKKWKEKRPRRKRQRVNEGDIAREREKETKGTNSYTEQIIPSSYYQRKPLGSQVLIVFGVLLGVVNCANWKSNKQTNSPLLRINILGGGFLLGFHPNKEHLNILNLNPIIGRKFFKKSKFWQYFNWNLQWNLIIMFNMTLSILKWHILFFEVGVSTFKLKCLAMFDWA